MLGVAMFEFVCEWENAHRVALLSVSVSVRRLTWCLPSMCVSVSWLTGWFCWVCMWVWEDSQGVCRVCVWVWAGSQGWRDVVPSALWRRRNRCYSVRLFAAPSANTSQSSGVLWVHSSSFVFVCCSRYFMSCFRSGTREYKNAKWINYYFISWQQSSDNHLSW